MQVSQGEVKHYYVAGELYDWITDPKGLERLFHRSRARVAARILRRVGDSIVAVDVGCGTGLITCSIRARVVIGFDINLWNLRRAKTRIRLADFVQCDSDHLPLRDGIVDLSVATEVLEHLSSPTTTLHEIARVMRRNGRFVGSVPSRSPLWRLRNILSITHPKSEPFHNNFSRGQFAALISTAFERPRVFYDNFFMTIFCIADHPRKG